jgi:UPF0755 protein
MRRLFAVVLLVVVLSVVAAGAWVAWVVARPFGPARETFVDIAPGTTTDGIAQQLAHAGIVRSPYSIELLQMVSGGTLKAGEYRFDHAVRPSEVLLRIERGDVYTIALAIPEGANLFDIAARVQTAKLGTSKGFLLAAAANLSLIHTLDPKAPSLEGYLFPATYRFGRHTTYAEMLHRMVATFEVQALALGITGDTHRVVTLASLVERETPIPSERNVVASVFINRLTQDMPLETDPTVIYAALLRDQYTGTITRANLQIDSPYNTYLHSGLPPGPICNPGVISLRAALHPAKTSYLYFVAAGADPLGHSRFSSTLAEHQRNVAAYRAAVKAAASAR